MAIYHFHLGTVSRNRGENVVRVAAYYAKEHYYNERLGLDYDYSKVKEKPLRDGIMLCKNAPAIYKDRAVLWNTVESAEKSRNARLAMVVDASLPAEYDVYDPKDLQYLQELVKQFIQDNFVSMGMCADWFIIEKGQKNYNPGLVVLLTTRAIKENGEWDTKEATRYKLDENGEKIPLIDPATGKQKLRVRERKGTSRMWVRETIKPNTFYQKENLLKWRKNWADTVNQALADKGLKERVDHRSYAEQGIDKIPEIHLGRTTAEMHARGEKTERMDDYNMIQDTNRKLDHLNEIIETIDTLKKEMEEEIKKGGVRK